VFSAFKVMAKLRFLRGTALDVFGYTAERKMERQLIADYVTTVTMLLEGLDTSNVALAAEIASVPEHIRGFGHVKEAHLHPAKQREAELIAQWKSPKAAVATAA
jgi:indolepyruvate ferredoxin oxidoreductase